MMLINFLKNHLYLAVMLNKVNYYIHKNCVVIPVDGYLPTRESVTAKSADEKTLVMLKVNSEMGIIIFIHEHLV